MDIKKLMSNITIKFNEERQKYLIYNKYDNFLFMSYSYSDNIKDFKTLLSKNSKFLKFKEENKKYFDINFHIEKFSKKGLSKYFMEIIFHNDTCKTFILLRY